MDTVPQWLKKKVVVNEAFFETKKVLADFSVNTVCRSSMCPNSGECFSRKKATFMILGKTCTRNCSFCSVTKGATDPVDEEEPRRIAGCAERLGLKYVIVTSVTRDDLGDGGASQFTRVVESIREISKDIVIEFLIPDLGGQSLSIEKITDSRADIIGHNIETVNRLYSILRSRADYSRSLNVLRMIKRFNPGQLTKSAILVGLGESQGEVVDTMRDLRTAGCDMLAIGQYLRPSKEHAPVKRFVTPEEFEEYKSIGKDIGFKNISSGPFVRSSYLAEETYNLMRRPT